MWAGAGARVCGRLREASVQPVTWDVAAGGLSVCVPPAFFFLALAAAILLPEEGWIMEGS